MRKSGRTASLRFVVIAPFAAMLLLSVALVVAVTLRSQGLIAADYSARLLSSETENVRSRLMGFLSEPFRACKAAADAIGRGGVQASGRFAEAEAYLRSDLETHLADLPQVGATGFGNEAGDYLGFRREDGGGLTLMEKSRRTGGRLVVHAGSDRSSAAVASFEGYDPRTRPWYAPVAAVGRALWSPIYTDYDERQAVSITACAPILSEGAFVGVVGYDVKLDDFNAFLEDESGRRGGSTYVVDGQGLLIANSSGAAALADGGGDLPRGERLPARASGDPVIAGTAAVLLPAPYVGGGQVRAVEIEGRRVFCRALPVAVAGGIIWNIVVALPENVLLGRLRRDGERALLLASLAALAALAVGVVLLGRVAAQLRRGSEAADAIAAGARNTRLPEDSRVRETRQLAAAFNSMTDALVSATVDLEKTVDARTVELRGANELLGKALEDSKRAQVQLILAEKMAALGHLVAGIAHELNTPVAAIVAANEIVAETLTEDLPGILAALESLGPAERTFVAEALAEIRHPESISTGYEPAAERRGRAALEARFEAAGVADAPQAADDLAALGLAAFGERLAPALAGPSREPLLRALRGLAAAARSARLVGESAEKASRVVAALQTYVRGEAVTETAPVDIGRELANILARHRGKIRGGVELAAELAGAAPALGRRDELNLVWTNLLENALYAVGDRGRVEVGARVVGDMVEVWVSNDGPEIPDSLKPRIFEPFFSTKPAGEGAGIGLNLSRKIVEAGGGAIGFESAPGRTRFWVRLPLAEPSAGN